MIGLRRTLSAALFALLLFPVFSSAQSVSYAGKPEDVGFSHERLDRIADTINTDIAKGVIPGATLLIARNGKIAGCGHLLMYQQLRNAVLVDLLPELLPPALGEGESPQTEDDLRALWGPAHSRTAEPLFDQCFARRLSDP